MTLLTGAQFLADSLNAYGVTHVFFVPAILNQTLAEMERRTGISRVMTHGEKSAVYMADGYARASGRPGVTLAQCVGAANLAAALRDPFLGCSPVLAVTGGPYHQTRHRHTYQEIDDFSMFAPVTKYQARVDELDRLPDVLRQAFRSTTSGNPGPAHIELRGHMGELERERANLEVLAEPSCSMVPAVRTAADADSIAAVARLLEQSQRPVIVAGGGARWSGAGPKLLALAERLAIPLATSLNAKDLVPAGHPLSVGVPGLYSRKSANQAVLEADLVFFIGSHTGSQVTCRWQLPSAGTPVIQLDIEPEELGRHYPNTASLAGDARTVLAQLLEVIDQTTAAGRRAWCDRAAGLVTAWREDWRSLMRSEAVPLRPERLCGDLSRLLPHDALLVSETGHSGMWTAAMVDLVDSDQGFIRAAGSLGWGLPAALGAQLAQPDRPVILFSGDGGFWYHLAELETAVRWNIPAVIVVNNNRSLNQEIELVTDAYHGTLDGRHGDLWQFGDTSLADVAVSLGCRGLRVERPGELDSALDEALSGGGPTVIEVITEMTALAPLAWLGNDKAADPEEADA